MCHLIWEKLKNFITLCRPWHEVQVIACTCAITTVHQEKALKACPKVKLCLWADIAHTKISVASSEFILIDMKEFNLNQFC